MNEIASNMLAAIGFVLLGHNFWFAISLWHKDNGIFRKLDNIYVRLKKGQGQPFNAGYEISFVPNVKLELKNQSAVEITIDEIMDIMKRVIPILTICNGLSIFFWIGAITLGSKDISNFLRSNMAGASETDFEYFAAWSVALAVVLHFIYMGMLHRSKIIDLIIHDTRTNTSKIVILIKLVAR